MKTIYTLLGVALVSLAALKGGAAAAGGLSVADADAQSFNGYGPGNQGATDEAMLAQNGSNSPWVTGDERLDMFQERFDLTDDQVATIREEVTRQIETDATPEEIRTTVSDMLADYGVEDPTLGPPADGRQAAGPGGQANGAGHGQGNGPADETRNSGHDATGGPYGPADGSCMN